MNIKTQRNSSLEMLKLIAIILIVFSHAMPFPDNRPIAEHYMNLELCTISISRLFIVFLRYGGQLGNAIFIVCSAWFLLDNKNFNIRWKKVFYIICDSFVISVVFLFVFYGWGEYDLSFTTIVKQFAPIIFGNNWFVGCYLIFYIIHPVLNLVVNNLSKNQLLTLNVVMVILYSCIQFLIVEAFYYTNLVGFIEIYFIVAYIKKYQPKFKNIRVNVILLVFSIIGLVGLVLATNYIGLNVDRFQNKLLMWNKFNNPFILLIAITSFNIAMNKVYILKPINFISSMSLTIYIVHCNRLISDYTRGDIFKYIYNTFTYENEILWVLLYGFGLLLFGIIISIVYKFTIQKISYKLCDKVCSKFSLKNISVQ